ncbi:hypothetical protein J2Z60_000177 [Lactobacillus colini]|uniref:Phage protein n=1 Tax=Lactobacillus colini TaxID=1819254 RepID=A0ABS4MBG2_9LACO|nr:DUF5361 domain-containing protein [Lactobacillus colini]MBP2057015.1 hypothetical protein [Lactobacillus colini]
MLNLDRDALECDFAETYHLYNIEELGLRKLSIYAYGLPENSRIKQKISGEKVSTDTYLLAMAVDSLQLLVWSKTKDAQHGINRPKSIAKAFISTKNDNRTYKSGQEFEQARAAILREIEGGE